MRQLNVAEAKSHLSELIEAAERGEEVIIARKGSPAVRLVAIVKPKRRLGFLGGTVTMSPDFDAPLDDFDEYQR